MWCIPEVTDEYIEKMEDVLDVYEKPFDPREPVVCLDEKPVQILADVREPLAAKPNQVKRRDNEYKRNGTGNVFCVVEPKAGKHITYASLRRTGRDYACLMKNISNEYPDARTIHVVMDNLNTHCEKSLTDFFGVEAGKTLWRRFTPHFTPKHGSWLNQAEIECSMFAQTCIGKDRIGDHCNLILRTKAWTKDMNRRRVTIDWKFTKEKARKKFKYRSRRKLQSLSSESDKAARRRD